MVLVACATLAAAALLYVFWVTPEPLPAKTPAQREREFLEERKEVVYENLRDLHLEYRMGKLAEDDYQQLKAHYQEQLAALLHSLEALPQAESKPVPGRCARCGRDNPAENRYCGACGATLAPLA